MQPLAMETAAVYELQDEQRAQSEQQHQQQQQQQRSSLNSSAAAIETEFERTTRTLVDSQRLAQRRARGSLADKDDEEEALLAEFTLQVECDSISRVVLAHMHVYCIGPCSQTSSRAARPPPFAQGVSLLSLPHLRPHAVLCALPARCVCAHSLCPDDHHDWSGHTWAASSSPTHRCGFGPSSS
jgi:hypothetical protein